MKTTLDLDPRLIEEATCLAAEREVTLTSIIEDALRDSLAQRRPVPPVPFDMPVVEGRTRPIPRSPTGTLSTIDWMIATNNFWPRSSPNRPVLHGYLCHWKVLRVARSQHRVREQGSGSDETVGLRQRRSMSAEMTAPITGLPTLPCTERNDD